MKTGTRVTVRAATSVVLLLSLGLMAAGCGAVPLAQYAGRRVTREVSGIRYDGFAAVPLGGDFARYQRLEVVPLENEMGDLIPAELVAGLNEGLLRQLQQVRNLEVARAEPTRQRTSPGAGAQARAGDPSAPAPGPADPAASAIPLRQASVESPTAVLEAIIVDFDPGSQGQRVLQVGVGRQAVLTLHLWFLDGATGQLLGKYIINSEVYRLGSDPDAMVGKLSTGIGELLANVLAAHRPADVNVPRDRASRQRQ